ncbi:MAG: hypothetical protein F6J93_07265 [Oscillatoria sp. SIO1A7]|nr:hypothetical protein [Oscillatoria sp. SIO1A7]
MPNAQCPMPNAQCPMPNAQCPMPNAQCPMPNAQVVYQTFFADSFVREIIESLQMKLLVFVTDKQEIALWKE